VAPEIGGLLVFGLSGSDCGADRIWGSLHRGCRSGAIADSRPPQRSTGASSAHRRCDRSCQFGPCLLRGEHSGWLSFNIRLNQHCPGGRARYQPSTRHRSSTNQTPPAIRLRRERPRSSRPRLPDRRSSEPVKHLACARSKVPSRCGWVPSTSALRVLRMPGVGWSVRLMWRGRSQAVTPVSWRFRNWGRDGRTAPRNNDR
jgi:hypothetical protein